MIVSSVNLVCRACGTKLAPSFLDLGKQPLANNLCTETEHADETFAMRLCRCGECGLLQLDTVIDPASMFSHYLYTPSQSRKTLEHFEELAATATKRVPRQGAGFAVDVGSNDGALLRMLQARRWRVCGVDPAENLAQAANECGLTTVAGFFTDSVVDTVLRRYGRADLITANNVFAHTPDWTTFARCAAKLLADGGLVAIEFPYGPTMLADGTFDLCYFEHASYPGLIPVARLFQRYHLYVRDVEYMTSIHGGSARVWLGGRGLVSERVEKMMREEVEAGSLEACARFVEKVERTKRDLAAAVREERRKGRRVVGYTAPAKAVTLLQACRLGLDDIECVVDDNPLKQGRLLPVSHIPIRSVAEAKLKAGDVVLIFAWNVAEDITAKLPPGVDVIVPMPDVRVVRRS